EVETLVCDRRHQRVDRAVLYVMVDEGLRRDEAAREGDVGDAGIGLARELNGRLLRQALRELVARIHEYRRDAIIEIAGELGVGREVHPAEFLDRRLQRRQGTGNDVAVRIEKVETVGERRKLVGAGRLTLDREADKVLRRLAILPVHAEQRHAVAAMQLERERRTGIRTQHLETRGSPIRGGRRLNRVGGWWHRLRARQRGRGKRLGLGRLRRRRLGLGCGL